MDICKKINEVSRLIKTCKVLMINTGAGIGVDSGLPDFRGKNGFYREQPALKHLKLSFMDMANPNGFFTDPCLAWGFYGLRLQQYRDTTPGVSFDILRKWAQKYFNGNQFIVTSNVDGHFAKAGFDESKINEIHGSIHYIQDLFGRDEIISADNIQLDIDPSTCRVKYHDKLPQINGKVARPNILMFEDQQFNNSRNLIQIENQDKWEYDNFQNNNKNFECEHRLNNGESDVKLLIIEIGAGKSVPTIRQLSNQQSKKQQGILVRINPTDQDECHIGLNLNSEECLKKIDNLFVI